MVLYNVAQNSTAHNIPENCHHTHFITLTSTSMKQTVTRQATVRPDRDTNRLQRQVPKLPKVINDYNTSLLSEDHQFSKI